jgi:hypothetical protein
VPARQRTRDMTEVTFEEVKQVIGDLYLELYAVRQQVAALSAENERLRRVSDERDDTDGAAR